MSHRHDCDPTSGRRRCLLLHFRVASPRSVPPSPRGGFHRLLTPLPLPHPAPARALERLRGACHPRPPQSPREPLRVASSSAPRRVRVGRKPPRLHLRPERPERLPDHLPDARVLLRELRRDLGVVRCPPSPSRSWYTSTWPLVAAPAPMPMVGPRAPPSPPRRRRRGRTRGRSRSTPRPAAAPRDRSPPSPRRGSAPGAGTRRGRRWTAG